MNTIICPTILVDSVEDFQIAAGRLNFAERGQVDLTDGVFATSRTISVGEITELPWAKTDFHLMVNNPAPDLQHIVDLRPNLVILHAEANIGHENLKKIIHRLHEINIKVGLALLPETQPDTVAELLSRVDHCLIFGGHLGFMGGEADLSQLEKIPAIHRIAPFAEIGWDGGANAENIRQIAAAGVNVINVGSAISKSEDSKRAYNELNKIITKIKKEEL